MLPQMVEAGLVADGAEVRDEARRIQRIRVDHAARNRPEAVGEVEQAERGADHEARQAQQQTHFLVAGRFLPGARRADLPVDRVDHLVERLARRLELALDGDERRAVLDPDLGAERDPLAVALPELPALHEAVHAGAQIEGLRARAQEEMEERDRAVGRPLAVLLLEELERGLEIDVLREMEDGIVAARRDEGHEAAHRRELAHLRPVGTASEHGIPSWILARRF